MSNEIFISYRRSDSGGHAHSVRDGLLKRFENSQVFFDHQSIPVATRFADEIASALTQCSVVLVLIGPTWAQVERDGQRRLFDPEDLVRQEVARALEAGKHVVPVLLDGAAMPEPGALPSELAALCALNAHVQASGRTRDDDLLRLADLIVQWGVVPRSPKVPSEREKLPLLCDRSKQQQALSDTVDTLVRSEQRLPMVLTLLGCADEEHWAFIERLQTFSLPRLFKKTPFAPGDSFVSILELLPVDGDQAGFDQRLRAAIATKLRLGPIADDETLLLQVKKAKRKTLVVVLSWHLSELDRHPELALQRVFDYWAKFPPLGPRFFAACVVCLMYGRKEEAARRGWWARLLGGKRDAAPARDDRIEALKLVVQQTAQAFSGNPRVAWIAPPELAPVTSTDLERWRDAVRDESALNLERDKLAAILEGQPRSMAWVLPRLEALLTDA